MHQGGTPAVEDIGRQRNLQKEHTRNKKQVKKQVVWRDLWSRSRVFKPEQGTAVGLNNGIPLPNEKQGYYILFIHIASICLFC